jgi:hypothetical protein
MPWEKGDIVVASQSARVPYASSGSRLLLPGEELRITSVRDGAYGCKPIVPQGQLSYVVIVPESYLEKPTRMLGEVPEGGLDPEDPRIAWIFEDAAKLADRLGLCRDYDRLADQLGIPGRVRDFKITFDGAEQGVTLTATIKARSRRQAEARLQSMTKVPVISSVKAVGQ